MKNKGRKFLIAVGVLFLIESLLTFLSNGIPSQLLHNTFFGVSLVLMGMSGIFQDYEYFILNKSSYIALLSLTIYSWTITAYIYLFKPVFTIGPDFYIFAVLLIFLTAIAAFGYKKFREYQKAVEPYEKTLKIKPADVTALNNKGIILAGFKAYPQAVECFDETLKIDPENVQAMYCEGNVLAKMKIYQTAVEYYDKALKLDSNNIDILNNKGNALTKLEKYPEAVDCYNAALELDHNDVSVWHNKGNALQELRKCKEALECYRKVLELEPDFEFTKKAKNILKINN